MKRFMVCMDISVPIEVEVEALDCADAATVAKHNYNKNHYVGVVDKSMADGNDIVEVVDVEEIHG